MKSQSGSKKLRLDFSRIQHLKVGLFILLGLSRNVFGSQEKQERNRTKKSMKSCLRGCISKSLLSLHYSTKSHNSFHSTCTKHIDDFQILNFFFLLALYSKLTPFLMLDD